MSICRWDGLSRSLGRSLFSSNTIPCWNSFHGIKLLPGTKLLAQWSVFRVSVCLLTTRQMRIMKRTTSYTSCLQRWGVSIPSSLTSELRVQAKLDSTLPLNSFQPHSSCYIPQLKKPLASTLAWTREPYHHNPLNFTRQSSLHTESNSTQQTKQV